MLQTALLLLGCALSKYLWTISHIFSGVILAFTVFGVASHVFFTLAAIFSHGCPYQTPLSLLFRTATRHLAQSKSSLARWTWSVAALPSTLHSNSGASAQAFSPRSSHSPSTQLGSEVLPQTHAWVVVFPGGESSGADLRNLLQAISDPFEFTPDPPLHDKQPSPGVDYDPMMAGVVLIGFASSDLWQIHLQQLNFTSCGNFVSTDEGRKAALKCMTDTVVDAWSGFFCTSSKVAATVKCLEELRCPNTAQVVKEWATAHHWRCACYHRYLCIRGCDLKVM